MAAAAAVSVPRIKLGSQGLEVSAQGLGCMSMSGVYGPHTNEILLGKVGWFSDFGS